VGYRGGFWGGMGMGAVTSGRGPILIAGYMTMTTHHRTHFLEADRVSNPKSKNQAEKKRGKNPSRSDAEMCEFLTTAKRSRGMYNMALYTIVAPPDLWQMPRTSFQI